MKKWVVILFICCLANSFSQTNISPQFSELKGMEDQLGNTHLFYRIYEKFSNQYVISEKKNIFHMDLNSGIDTFFLSDSRLEAPTGNYINWVADLDFWNNNPFEFIYCGGTLGGPYYEGMPYVRRHDGYETTFQGFAGSADYVDISLTNDSLLYLGGWVQPTTNPYDFDLILAKSLDGGLLWDTLSLTYRFLSIIPYRENIFFVDDIEAKLYRTTDLGSTFNLVDPEFLPKSRFSYDSDQKHIYRTTTKKLIVSNDLGEPFSWQTKYSSESEIFISIDESTSGTIYLADKKNIFVSTDYGNSFSLYKPLERNIVGIYKKPYSNKLYAASKYKIYEITPDTIQVIKSLPIPEDAYDWFPLNPDDKWIYLNTFYGDLGDSIRWVSTNEVTGYKMLDDKVFNEVLVEEIPIDPGGNSGLYYEHFRIDSSDGKIYKAEIENDSLLFEELYMDLLVEVGDTIQVGNGIYLESEVPATIFGVDTRRRNFFSTQTPYEDIKLAKGFGLAFKLVWELVEIRNVLQGCIISGVIYGDTTTVGVEDEENPMPATFKLEQNYPNPFNPSTIIRYWLPVTSNVTLKVYDILGNEVATLVNEELQAGEYELEFSPESSIKNPASGIYFYQLKAGEFIQTKKMVLIK